ncbi:hypothetical protein WG66_014886 [Moniliophthora roreri]|nr:hypothetical protein WG66_014886 [Moniliophthora roreri]
MMGNGVSVAEPEMFLWDFILHLGTEYRLLSRQKFRLPTIVYFLSRVSALFGLLSGTIFFTAPLDDYCSFLAKLMFGSLPPAITATSLLLFFRVSAVYTGNKRVVTAFFLYFLVVMGCSTLIPFTGIGEKVGPINPFCTIAKKDIRLVAAMLTIPLVNNIAIFIAVSVKLMPEEETENYSRDVMSKVQRFLRGKHLPGLSKTLFQDGQKYILTFIVITLITLAILSTRILPDIYGYIILAPHSAIENSVNCYLFRSVRASASRPDQNMETNINFRTNPELETQDLPR